MIIITHLWDDHGPLSKGFHSVKTILKWILSVASYNQPYLLRTLIRFLMMWDNSFLLNNFTVFLRNEVVSNTKPTPLPILTLTILVFSYELPVTIAPFWSLRAWKSITWTVGTWWEDTLFLLGSLCLTWDFSSIQMSLTAVYRCAKNLPLPVSDLYILHQRWRCALDYIYIYCFWRNSD